MSGVTSEVYVAFSAHTGLVSRLIRWITRGRVSHAAILYKSSTWGGTWVAEATGSGVHTYPMPKGCDWKYVWRIDYNVRPGLEQARRYFEEHYDFLGAIVFGWVIILGRLLKKRVTHPFRSSSGQFCSEFVARVLYKFVTTNPQWTTPEDLLELVEKNEQGNFYSVTL